MKAKLHLILVAVFCTIGLVDSAYLTYDHFSHNVVPGYDGGLCGVDGGCELARTSSLSELPMPGDNPGLPIALMGFAFYVAFFALTLAFHKAIRDGGARARSLQAVSILLALGSVLYSVALAAWSLSKGSLCPFCSILYVTNIALLVLSVRVERGAAWTKGDLFPALGRALRLGPTVLTALVFLGVMGGGYFIYRAAYVSAAAAAAANQHAPIGEADITTRPAEGPVNAPIQIVEFADFQCPHCQSAFNHLTELTTAFPDDVRVTFLNFPLDQACNPLIDRAFHERACHLARVGECAWRQNRYVDAARVIYQQQRLTDDAGVLAAVVALGLDAAALNACIADESSLKSVRGDIDIGIAAELRGTPSIFVNGEMLRGPLTHDDIKARIAAIKGAKP